MAPDPPRFAALLCDYCLEVQPGQQVVVRSSTLAAPLLLALQEQLLEREAWPLIRAELPGAEEAFWQPRATRTSTASRRRARRGARAPTPRIAHPGAGQHPRARGRRRRADGARRPRPRPVREAAMRRRWCVTLWPTAAGAQQAGMGTTEFAAFVDAPCSSTATTRRRPGASCATSRPASSSGSRRRARAAHRGRRHRPDADRRGPHVGQLRRQAQHALAARSSPARSRRAPRAASASRSRRARAASTSTGSSSSSATAASWTPAPGAARST